MRKLFNYIVLQAGWFGCVTGAAKGYPWLGSGFVVVILLFFLWREKRRLGLHLRMMLGAFVTGLIVDSAQKASGLVVYHSDTWQISWLAPVYILALWVLYSTTFDSSLDWMRKNLWLAALVGGLFGPLSYLAGVKMGAIHFPGGDNVSLLILAGVWILVNPWLSWLANRIYSDQRTIPSKGNPGHDPDFSRTGNTVD